MQTTYAGRKGIFECCSTPLEQSAACHACHRLPQFFQEATEDISVEKSDFTLKERFYNIRTFLICTIYQLFFV